MADIGVRSAAISQAVPPATMELPKDLQSAVGAGADPAGLVADGHDMVGEAESFSDVEDEFAQGFDVDPNPNPEKMDCPKACYASGDCHAAE